MTSVLVDQKLEIVVCRFNFLYSTGRAPKFCRAGVTYPLLSLWTSLGALITC